MTLSTAGSAAGRHTPLPEAAVRVLWYVAAIGGVAAVTLLLGLLQNRLPPTRLQMTYLLLVLALAIGAGRGVAIFASVLAFLTFDWFFVKPVGNLVVNDPVEWFALSLFLVVGISTGSLAAGLKRSAAEAQRRGRETAILYELSMAILSDSSLERVLGTVVERVIAAVDLQAATILLADGEGRLHLVAQAIAPGAEYLAPQLATDREAGAVYESLVARGAEHEGEVITGQPTVQDAVGMRLRGRYLPLWLNGRPLGLLATYDSVNRPPPPPQDPARLLNAFAVQASLAVGRIRLVEEEERAHAAAESDRVKSSFLASISHDLRTPLTAIKTAAALLHSSTDAPARSDARESIDQEVDRLNHLVGNLLEISRLESGSAPMHLLLEDLTDVLGATADRFAALLAGRRLLLQAPPDVPPVLLDAAQFDRVFSNLLENAIKFSPPQSTLTVEVIVQGSTAIIRTHNIGPAIPAGQQQRVFEKFYQLEGSRRLEAGRRLEGGRQSHAGSGLGLAICRGIVEAHGGQIWTRNEDRGVAFYVSLPLAEQPAAVDLRETLEATVEVAAT